MMECLTDEMYEAAKKVIDEVMVTLLDLLIVATNMKKISIWGISWPSL